MLVEIAHHARHEFKRLRFDAGAFHRGLDIGCRTKDTSLQHAVDPRGDGRQVILRGGCYRHEHLLLHGAALEDGAEQRERLLNRDELKMG